MLRKDLLELLYEENVQSDSGIESLADSIEHLIAEYITDIWSIDDCK